jgi:hypothetical protein
VTNGGISWNYAISAERAIYNVLASDTIIDEGLKTDLSLS